MKTQQLSNKRLRARLLRDFYGQRELYCFSCGNASRALEEIGANITRIEPDGYVTPKEALDNHPGINVTSGCLPITLMESLSDVYRNIIRDDGGKFYVPCGSGETLLALSFFIPTDRLIAVTADYAPVRFDYMTPLYSWVRNNLYTIALGKVSGIQEMKTYLNGLPGTFVDTSGQGLIYNG